MLVFDWRKYITITIKYIETLSITKDEGAADGAAVKVYLDLLDT